MGSLKEKIEYNLRESDFLLLDIVREWQWEKPKGVKQRPELLEVGKQAYYTIKETKNIDPQHQHRYEPFPPDIVVVFPLNSAVMKKSCGCLTHMKSWKFAPLPRIIPRDHRSHSQHHARNYMIKFL